MQNRMCTYEIDKTKRLEEALKRFSAIYIEGCAATGKTTAVNRMLAKYPEVSSQIYRMSVELRNPEAFILKMQNEKQQMRKVTRWIVLDEIPAFLNPEISTELVEMVQSIENKSCVIFVSREKPQKEFLNLLWSGCMELITMERLMFSVEEVRAYVEATKSRWNAKELFEKTGGWPGVVHMLVRLREEQEEMAKDRRVSLFETYEMKQYIEQEILAALTEDEIALLRHIAGCPWVTESLCAQVWNIKNAPELLYSLHRKGMLVYFAEKKYWKMNGLFFAYVQAFPLTAGLEDAWYEQHGYFAEAFGCLRKSGDEQKYHECLLRNYQKVPSSGHITKKVLSWSGMDIKDCYFRGVHHYRTQNFEGLQKEIANLQKFDDGTLQIRELLLNLSYLNPQMSLAEWLDLLKEYTKDGKKFRLYHILGCGASCLCGIRDLAGLFHGTKKENRSLEKLWKKSFHEYEWKCYQHARIDFYLETNQKDEILEEDWELIRQEDNNEPWQLRLSKLYLLCKLQRESQEEEFQQKILRLEESLKEEPYEVCGKNAEALSSLYAPWYGEREKLTQWLREASLDGKTVVVDENYWCCCCAVKGYLLSNQYEKAEKLTQKLIAYLQPYHRNRLLAELLFQQGIIFWKKDLKGHAIRSAIESFLLGGESRYVGIYASHGQRGYPLLESYVEWQMANAPEGWSRKKKYNYGNVLRMPRADYVQVVLRCTKKVSKSSAQLPENDFEEHLTMMETMVLQKISQGMSNAKICDVLGLKMPTVKGHAYNLYKKLGVENRTQAISKGRELGIID